MHSEIWQNSLTWQMTFKEPRSHTKTLELTSPAFMQHNPGQLSSLPYLYSTYCYSPLEGKLVHHSLPLLFHPVSVTICQYPFILLARERHCKSCVSCQRTQHNDAGFEPTSLHHVPVHYALDYHVSQEVNRKFFSIFFEKKKKLTRKGMFSNTETKGL